jgi:phytoene synthase
MMPQAYCRDVLDRRAPEWRVMLNFTSPGSQPLLEALFALRVELEDLVAFAVEPGVAAAKLQWWRDALAAYPQHAEHPIITALVQADNGPLDRDRLLAWCDGLGVDLQRNEIVDERDLDDLLLRRGGNFGALLASVLDHRAALAGQQWGAVVAWHRHLLRLPRQASHGIVELPAAWLIQSDITTQQLAVPQPEAPAQAFYARLVDQAHQQVERVRAAHPSRPALLPHQLELSLCARRLDRWQRQGFEASAAQQTLPPLRRLGLLWCTARRHRRDARRASRHFIQP